MMNQSTLCALQLFPEQFEAYYEAIPEDCKHWKPDSWQGIPSESLSAIEQICHVRDIEIYGYHARIQKTLTESNPMLVSIDTYALVKEHNYIAANPADVFASFRQARKQTMSMLEGLTPGQYSRTADFEGYGALTMRSLVHYLCSHDQQHLAGLQWLLGKIEAWRGASSATNG